MKKRRTTKLIIIASTFPRWANDSVPTFVLQHAKSMKRYFENVLVLAPHYKGAKTKDELDAIEVKRFRYFWPASAENIVYDGGGAQKVSKSPLYLLKLAGFFVAEFFSTLRQVWKNKDVIVNAHWLIPQGTVAILVKKLTGVRVVISIHGGDIFTLNGGFMTKIKRYTLKFADMVVVNSSATLEACKQVYANKEYVVIPMSIDVKKFQKQTVKNQGTKFTIVSTGRLSEEKGMIYVCQAMKQLVAKYPDATLKIIGMGPEEAQLKHYIADNGLQKNVELLGWVQHNELINIYHTADVFVGASQETSNGWKEAFGLVFAEASAAELPIIATDLGGIKDIVQEGKTGYLVKQKDPQAIAAKLQYLYGHPKIAKDMGAKGSAFIKENFDEAVIAKKYSEVFKTIKRG